MTLSEKNSVQFFLRYRHLAYLLVKSLSPMFYTTDRAIFAALALKPTSRWLDRDIDVSDKRFMRPHVALLTTPVNDFLYTICVCCTLCLALSMYAVAWTMEEWDRLLVLRYILCVFFYVCNNYVNSCFVTISWSSWSLHSYPLYK